MDLFGINGWEIVVLLLLAMFIFGPDRLPKVIGDGVKMIRNLRDMARNATVDLSRELGTDISLEDLHPKTFIRKHLLSEEDERAMRRPLDDLYHDVRNDLKGVQSELKGVTARSWAPGRRVKSRASGRDLTAERPRSRSSTGGPTAITRPAVAGCRVLRLRRAPERR